ncbi:hypothetical protein QBC37DRAFT_403952 [Rhypophila decipiens]|uniref:Uncharacterized protein n=1 Tax=Rhypophila decipiens TaxID=261697 RepID=A0AAN6XZX5_9PEZI|nr:hypothetical protein QBC37DRAFT_403952 [Rhypophila decipiens]
MRELTVADAAFLLLCTSKHGSFQLSLSTEIGLYLDFTSDGTITASLEKPKPPLGLGRRQSATPITPISPIRNSIDAMMLTPTSSAAPEFPTFTPANGFVRSNTPPHTPDADSNPSLSLRGRKPLQVKTIHPPTFPATEPTPPASPVQNKSLPRYKYIITPSLHAKGQGLLSASKSTYIFYAPDWPHDPRSRTLSSISKFHDAKTPRRSQDTIETPGEIIVCEEDLEARYSSSISSSNSPSSGSNWLDSYLDWVSRSKRACARQRRREARRASRAVHYGCASNGHYTQMAVTENVKDTPIEKKGLKGPFKDEGESILWIVEGLLLAVWLSLQGDCSGVEYAPWGGEVYTLDKATVGKVIRGVLDGLNWC